MPDANDRVHVAIVGGGCAGVSAAWQLSRFPELYEVHVYERDWRLGGKGASGRNAEGRIIEHGLHVWLGFYENAFRMVRECYAEVERWSPEKKKENPLTHYSFEDAFACEPHIGVAFDSRPDLRFWSGFFPPTAGTPGDPLDEDTNPFTLSNYLVRCFMLLKALSQSVVGGPDADSPRGRRGKRSTLDVALDRDPAFDATKAPAAIIDTLAGRIRSGMLAGAGGLEQAFHFLERWARRMREDTGAGESTLRLIEAVAAQARKQMGDLTGVDRDVRAKMEVIDIVMTIAVGLYRDRVLFGERGLDAINDMDYKAWLRKHGATEAAVESPFINGIYDLTFAFRDGDRTQPALAAGVALRGALRMFFTYRGAMFWRLSSGMGDAVFAPMYRVLLERGVKFHFMHRLEHLVVAPLDGKPVASEMTFQVRQSPGDPLDAAGCWAHLDKDALGKLRVVNRVKLVRGNNKDFDAVVLALPIESLREVLGSDKAAWIAHTAAKAEPKSGAKARKDDGVRQPLISSLPDDWQKALRYLTTAATQSAQVWVREDLDQLGWKRGSTFVTALPTDGFQTWADMTHTLPHEEAWRRKMGIKIGKDAGSVAYLCGVVAEPAAGKRPPDVKLMEKTLNDQGKANIEAVFGRIFPAYARKPKAFQIMGQHFVANIESSGRYTLSQPGTIHYRLSPLDGGIANLALAGDWTACGLDAGCVESAVMSGMLAAHAITGREPSLDSIVGYDHP